MYKTEGTQYGSLCTEDSPGSALGYQDSTQQKEHEGRGIPGPGECGMRRQGAETLRFIQFKHELRTGLKFWERLQYAVY